MTPSGGAARPRARAWLAVVALAVAPIAGSVGLAAGLPAFAAAAAPEQVAYRPPTDGPVLDPFRPPPRPWLAGNRGIEYRTVPGSALTAIGAGTVTFAGPVAGRTVISVQHPDGLRSSLTGVGALLVRAGDQVEGGQVVAAAEATVHLGVRRGETYIDPASLWGTDGRGVVFLVPLDGDDTSVATAPAPAAGADLRSVVRHLLERGGPVVW